MYEQEDALAGLANVSAEDDDDVLLDECTPYRKIYNTLNRAISEFSNAPVDGPLPDTKRPVVEVVLPTRRSKGTFSSRC